MRPATHTISYVVRDPGSTACAVVDSVMDIDYAAGRITYDSADKIIAYLSAHYTPETRKATTGATGTATP